MVNGESGGEVAVCPECGAKNDWDDLIEEVCWKCGRMVETLDRSSGKLEMVLEDDGEFDQIEYDLFDTSSNPGYLNNR